MKRTAESAIPIYQQRSSVTSSVFRFTDAEAALAKRFDAPALDGITLDVTGLNSDIHASAEYRAHCVIVMAKRAVTKALYTFQDGESDAGSGAATSHTGRSS